MNEPIDKDQDAGMFNEIALQSPNVTQVTIAIKVSQWGNGISSRERKKEHR